MRSLSGRIAVRFAGALVALVLVAACSGSEPAASGDPGPIATESTTEVPNDPSPSTTEPANEVRDVAEIGPVTFDLERGGVDVVEIEPLLEWEIRWVIP